MTLHWTYVQIEKKDSDLQQGDILIPSEALNELFKAVHPHFCNSKYVGFLVATQTCDLIRRRNGQPKAQYINLVAIRPLEKVLSKLIFQVIRPVKGTHFLLSNKKFEARQLLERILNQNEQALGLFYLHEDSDAGINEHSVCFLRVAVAVKSDLHYNELVSARRGRIGEAFQAKLGWLLGNLYSRPASKDWTDEEGGKVKLDKFVDQWMDQLSQEESIWIDEELVNAAAEQNVDLSSRTLINLESLRPRPALDRATTLVESVIRKVFPDVSDDKIQKITNRLRNDGNFKRLFKQPKN